MRDRHAPWTLLPTMLALHCAFAATSEPPSAPPETEANPAPPSPAQSSNASQPAERKRLEPQVVTFPKTFAFGTATAAYQIEGGWQEGGRGLSIWDAFAHTPGKVRTGETGDVAADHFHRFRSDVRLMAQMKLKYYRFSISWSRILPSGYGSVNEEGVKFYSNLIDELIANGIHPVATLYHWDLPLALQVEHDGWLSEATASAFVQYAAFCFSRFGDRVKHWITFNEPANHAVYGYARGEHAPGRSRHQTREPYIAAHFMLLAHAYAVARYRAEFQPQQRGLISIALNSDWREPASDSPADVAAAQRSMEFNLGWVRLCPTPHAIGSSLSAPASPARASSCPSPADRAPASLYAPSSFSWPLAFLCACDLPHLGSCPSSPPTNLDGWNAPRTQFADPLYLGDYPESMRARVGNRLPAFTAEQQGLLLNSTDFFALQHYSTMMVSMRPDGELDASSFYADEGVRHHGTPGARKNVLGWDIAPFGFHRLLRWVHSRYQPSGGIVVTENGLPLREESAEAARHDLQRVCYLKQYLAQLARAMREGVDVRGYFVWTLLDNFEWAQGTAPRFGLLYVDFATQRRTAKGSAAFYKALSETHSFTLLPTECNQTASVHPIFAAEALALQKLVNKTTEERQQTGQPSSVATRREIVTRAVRLSGLAEVQARHAAELGEFRVMRTWQGKVEKMRGFAERMRAQMARSVQQRQAGQQQQQQQQQQGTGSGGGEATAAGAAAAAAAAGAASPSGASGAQPTAGADGGRWVQAGANAVVDLPEVQTVDDASGTSGGASRTPPDGVAAEASANADAMVQTAVVDAAPVDQEES